MQRTTVQRMDRPRRTKLARCLALAAVLTTAAAASPPARAQEETTRLRWSLDLPLKSQYERNDLDILHAFRGAVGRHYMSTALVMHQERQVALGVVIDADGWLISKSSELPDGELTVRLSGSQRFAGRVVLRRSDLDLALVKVDATDLTPIRWDADAKIEVGSFLATAHTHSTPLAIGVVSVKPRPIRAAQAVLGIRLDEGPEGVLAVHVLQGGGAAAAGIQDDDLIVAIDGQQSKSLRTIQQMITSHRSGEWITVTIERDGERKDLQAQLTDMSIVLSDETEAEVNGDLSARASDFASAFQHDTVLTPNQCGGPLVDTHGRVVGLNIARAGRVHCFALPADVVVPAAQDMLRSAALALQSRTDGKTVLVDSDVFPAE